MIFLIEVSRCFEKIPFTFEEVIEEMNDIPLSYTEQDLFDLLKRHSLQGSKECDCDCPYTGNSIEILIQFVGYQNDVDEKIINLGCKLARAFLLKQRYGGKRNVPGGTLMYTASILLNNRISQETISYYFYITPVSIRKCYKLLKATLDLKKFHQKIDDRIHHKRRALITTMRVTPEAKDLLRKWKFVFEANNDDDLVKNISYTLKEIGEDQLRDFFKSVKAKRN